MLVCSVIERAPAPRLRDARLATKATHCCWIALFALVLLLADACSRNPTAPEKPISYVHPPPNGFFPWPQHDPAYSFAEYNQMMEQLFIINNFGQYQGGTTPESMYLHDGLDIILENETQLFSVSDGHVAAILGSMEGQRAIVIEDSGSFGSAWMYAHTDRFSVQPGDPVTQGHPIAIVSFPTGLGHVHLSRVSLREGGSWNSLDDYQYLFPDSFFFYPDSEPPVIETPFYFYQNKSDTEFPRTGSTVVSGEVDIVVAIRDPGEHARDSSGFGDRLCVGRIDYRILRDDHMLLERQSFDFRWSIIPRTPYENSEVAQTVYKFWYTVQTDPPQSYSQIPSFYIITNSSGTEGFSILNPGTQTLCWDTREVGNDGTPVFPNGSYIISVAAYDHAGNQTVAADTVLVQNP
ncbi:MAG: peptidoglycan DD-metalloendopeptidase family protein [Fidelibacterota bacterium]|nr:MAG: peptidoglycan DD-metalloendopeptidase family protein [Candidatus Neomarinimicrobiota bacterium]